MATVLAIVIAASMAAPVPALGVLLDRIVATIDDDVITLVELERAIRIGDMRRLPGESDDSFRDRVLDQMIDERLRYRDAIRFSPEKPDAAQIEKAYEDLVARLRKEGKDPGREFERAGLSADEGRALLERQLVVVRYLKERFYPLTYATTEEVRRYYEKEYVAEMKQGKPAQSFEDVAESLRYRMRERAFDEAVAKWTKDLREKARVAIYRFIPPSEGREPKILSPPK